MAVSPEQIAVHAGRFPLMQAESYMGIIDAILIVVNDGFCSNFLNHISMEKFDVSGSWWFLHVDSGSVNFVYPVAWEIGLVFVVFYLVVDVWTLEVTLEWNLD